MSDHNHWTGKRIARLAYLIYLGWDAKRIAEDDLIKSTANNVHQQANRFGLVFRSIPPSPFHLPPKVIERYDAAAAKRGISREALVRNLLLAAGSDSSLIENILDDEDGLSDHPFNSAAAPRRHMASQAA